MKEYLITVRFTAPYCCATVEVFKIKASSADNARMFVGLHVPGGSYNVRILNVQQVAA